MARKDSKSHGTAKVLFAGVIVAAMASGAHAHATTGHSSHNSGVPASVAAVPMSGSSGEAYANQKAAAAGWGSQQIGCLDELWTRESDFDRTIRNPGGAFGEAQALGHGTPDTAAYDVHYVVSEGIGPEVGTVNEYGPEYGLTVADARAANAGSADEQIRWGLGYIDDTYGSPCGAEDHETQEGWY